MAKNKKFIVFLVAVGLALLVPLMSVQKMPDGRYRLGPVFISFGNKPEIQERNHSTAQERLRIWFAIPSEIKALNEAVIREYVLKKFPSGSTEQRILETLRHAGLGADDLDSYRRSANGRAVLRLACDQRCPFDLVSSEYRIEFRFDPQSRLLDVVPKIGLTGP